MKKRVLFNLLLTSFVFSFSCQNASQDASDFSYKIENGGIIMTGYHGSIKDVKIPGEIKGLPVLSIGERAFQGNELTSIVIGDSVETIGFAAFFNNKLTSVVIPNSVKTIEDYAFANNQLTNAVIGNSVETIGNLAFFNNKLTNVVIPNSVKTIGDYAFANNQLTNIVIPGSAVVEAGAFDYDVKITLRK